MKPRKREVRVEVRDSTIHGRGLFVLESIPKGARIIEYAGERVPEDEGNARYNATVPFHTFLFDLEDGFMVDGGVGGNEARFINHSCRPNVEAVIERGRIFIRARRAIAAGRELLLDYSFEPEDAHDAEGAGVVPLPLRRRRLPRDHGGRLVRARRFDAARPHAAGEGRCT